LQGEDRVEKANSFNRTAFERQRVKLVPEKATLGGETYMAAYVIAEVTITDPTGFETYRQMVPAAVAKYGGKFVIRGGQMETLEGSWEPKRLVVIEFESAERAKQWWASEDYREAKALRQRTAQTNLLVIEGV
jgi:uncharacterized protein (DUF1330 family)